MLNLPQIMLVAAAAFVAGWLVGRLGSLLQRKNPSGGDGTRERRIRSLEADLRVAQRTAGEADQQADAARSSLETAEADLAEARARLDTVTQECARAQEELRSECAKTQELREELSARAEDAIHSRLKIKELETELSLIQAGSETVADEVHRLEAEREELTNRLRALQDDQVDPAARQLPGENPPEAAPRPADNEELDS